MFESTAFVKKGCVFSRFFLAGKRRKIRFERIASTASVATLAKNARLSLAAETRIFVFWDSPKPFNNFKEIDYAPAELILLFAEVPHTPK